MHFDLTELAWESRFVSRLPGDPQRANFTRMVPGAAYSEVSPTPVRAPALVGWSDRLAEELGIARPSPAALEILAGNRVLPAMRPYAARYGGHQFGQWAGQLGDGRALTLGEAVARDGRRYEFQLKGAGPTPYSRRADGRAVLRSSLREFLCSEAMHFLGVPTTRALSLVTTGEDVVRDILYDGHPAPEPGAVVCRVAPSFLRFGNFEIASAHEEHGVLRDLALLLIEDHYPELDRGDADVFGKLLDEIARRTAVTVAHWMRVGFVHGVMNTDNMSALGLTIDYGPYGWLEPYDPDWTPNTTDAQGRRYRFGHQPAIAYWNLARLCEAMHPLIGDEERLHASLAVYRDTFERTHTTMLAQKLGVRSVASDEEQAIVGHLFGLMRASRADLTLFFRALCDWTPGEPLLERVSRSFYAPVAPDLAEAWAAWAQTYAARIAQDALPDAERRAAMKRANPKYVLRNYLAQTAIDAAAAGDASVLERLLRVLERPYDEQPGEEDLAAKRPAWAENKPGCSALSCSS
jgi:uncharacterized protein YdiU (UPF0061 family)